MGPASPISKQDELPHKDEKFRHVSRGAKLEVTRNCQILHHYYILYSRLYERYEQENNIQMSQPKYV